MKLLQVNYRRERGQDDPQQAEHLLVLPSASPAYRLSAARCLI